MKGTYRAATTTVMGVRLFDQITNQVMMIIMMMNTWLRRRGRYSKGKDI
jgi:hypothetical protein